MDNEQKHLSPKIWVPVLVGAALVVGYLGIARTYDLWPFGDSNIPSPGDGEGEGEVANWKTYRNEEFGFEVRYPQGRIINTPSGYCGICKFDIGFFTQAEFNAINAEEAAPFPQESIYIYVYEKTFSHKSLSDWYEENFGFSPLSTMNFELGNISGIKIIAPGAYPDSEYRTAYFIRGSTVFSIRAASAIELDQILSTFKFIK